MKVPSSPAASLLDDIEDLLDQSEEELSEHREGEGGPADNLGVQLDDLLNLDRTLPRNGSFENEIDGEIIGEGRFQQSQFLEPPECFQVDPEPLATSEFQLSGAAHINVDMASYHVVQPEPLDSPWDAEGPRLWKKETREDEEIAHPASSAEGASQTRELPFTWAGFARSILGGGTLMVFLMGGLLLWLEPLIAAGLAGYLGGRLAKNPWNGLMAALSPFIVLGVIGVVVTTLAAPIFAGFGWPSFGVGSGFVGALGQGVAEARNPASPLFAALLTMGFVGGLWEWLYKNQVKT